MDTNAIRNEMLDAAGAAANNVVINKNAYSVGFAWMTVLPVNRGNSKIAREERRTLENLGFKKQWTGAYKFQNPVNHSHNNIVIQAEGATAAAEVLRKYGFTVYVGSKFA